MRETRCRPGTRHHRTLQSHIESDHTQSAGLQDGITVEVSLEEHERNALQARHEASQGIAITYRA
jgi:hypothetical protein